MVRVKKVMNLTELVVLSLTPGFHKARRFQLIQTSGPIKPLSLYKNEENKYKMRPISIFFMKVAYKVMQREVQYIF